MKGGVKLHELQAQKAKEKEFAIATKPCTVCQKVLAGAYGRWLLADENEVWTCSKTCDSTYIERKKSCQMQST